MNYKIGKAYRIEDLYKLVDHIYILNEEDNRAYPVYNKKMFVTLEGVQETFELGYTLYKETTAYVKKNKGNNKNNIETIDKDYIEIDAYWTDYGPDCGIDYGIDYGIEGGE